MNVASLSLCYPSANAPHAGRFVRRRLEALNAHCHVRVLSPTPSPFGLSPRRQHREEGPPPAWFVPMPYVPGLSHAVNPWLYARIAAPLLGAWRRAGKLDVIDAHFCWPDGVAAAILAARFEVPYVVTLRGVLHRYTRARLTRRHVLRSLHEAAAVITVSDALRRTVVELGLSPNKVTTIRNGVDASVFHPGDRAAARRALRRSSNEKILITVGHLCRRKGVHRVLRVLPDLIATDPSVHYVVVGADAAEGRFEKRLRRLCKERNLNDHVSFTGPLPPAEVAVWLRAADLFVLPTTNEGCCNAICESIASGLPVVATDVGGNREIVGASAGQLVPPGDAAALRDAIAEALNRPPPGAPDRAIPSWSDTARTVHGVLARAAETSRHDVGALVH